MDFNQLVIEKIMPLFIGNDFSVTEHFNNYFRFKSNAAEATISFNELDNTSLFAIGNPGAILYPLNDALIKQVFDLNIKIEQVTKEKFVDNVTWFLMNSGSSLLKGDEGKLLQVKIFTEEESKDYTFQILQQQNLLMADKAWENGNYREYVRIIDQANKNKLPSSYLLKYKIANKKI